jgi:hypothetical protein
MEKAAEIWSSILGCQISLETLYLWNALRTNTLKRTTRTDCQNNKQGKRIQNRTTLPMFVLDLENHSAPPDGQDKLNNEETSPTFDRRVSPLVGTATHESNVWVLSVKGRKKEK